MMRERLEHWHRRLVSRGPTTVWEKVFFPGLVALSLLYGALLWLREKLYLSGFLRRYRAPIPVISVGNLSVGGTGKTPVTDMLVKLLLEMGVIPAVVSRGYGREVTATVEVVSNGNGPFLSPKAAGDEPFLLARRNQQAIVVVAARRADGIKRAIDLGAEVAILDDGFQHLAVMRDLDIVLLDTRRPLGNGLPVPAGLLREFPSALRRATMLMLTRAQKGLQANELQGKPLSTASHRLAVAGWDLEGEQVSSEQLIDARVAAFCGVADPEGFFDLLRARGVDLLQSLAFPDHVCYEEAELRRISELARGVDLLVTTEKDAVKLLEVELPCRCVVFPLELEMLSGAETLRVLLEKNINLKGAETMTLSPQLLEILACPACKGSVDYLQKSEQIVCPECKLAYPVRDEIPVMLIDEAVALEDK